MFSFGVAKPGCDEQEYDGWIATLAQASERLDILETAVAELCQLCRSGETRSEQILEVLEKHGAISKAAGSRFFAA